MRPSFFLRKYKQRDEIMTNELAGKVAVVTGASKGSIGHACAVAMLEAGARVVPVARDLETLKATYAEYGDAAVVMAADLVKLKDRSELVTRILQRTGQIDIFHANAGAYIGGNLVDNDPKQIENVLTLNIHGVMTPVHAVLPHMIERKTGDIVITGSIAGDGYNPYHEVVYGPSKIAAEQFGKLLRPQVSKQGIRVGVISPGPTKTPLVAGWDPERLAQAERDEVFISPKEVADAVMYMLTRPRHQGVAKMVVTPKNFTML